MDNRPKYQSTWFRRKKILINPRFQLHFTAFMTLVSCVTILLAFLSEAYFFERFREMAHLSGMGPGSQISQFIDRQEAQMGSLFVITSIFTFFLNLVIGLVFSHRISGPLYRIEKHLKALTLTGESQEVKLRKHDFFPEVAEALNALVRKRLRTRNEQNHSEPTES